MQLPPDSLGLECMVKLLFILSMVLTTNVCVNFCEFCEVVTNLWAGLLVGVVDGRQAQAEFPLV